VAEHSAQTPFQSAQEAVIPQRPPRSLVAAQPSQFILAHARIEKGGPIWIQAPERRHREEIARTRIHYFAGLIQGGGRKFPNSRKSFVRVR